MVDMVRSLHKRPFKRARTRKIVVTSADIVDLVSKCELQSHVRILPPEVLRTTTWQQVSVPKTVVSCTFRFEVHKNTFPLYFVAFSVTDAGTRS